MSATSWHFDLQVSFTSGHKKNRCTEVIDNEDDSTGVENESTGVQGEQDSNESTAVEQNPDNQPDDSQAEQHDDDDSTIPHEMEHGHFQEAEQIR